MSNYGISEAPARVRNREQVITVKELALAAGNLGVTPSQIFPPSWSTLTEHSAYDGNIIHSAEHEVEGVSVTLLHSHLTTRSGLKDFGIDALLKWRSTDVEGTSDDEQFAIYLKDIPALIEALQFVQKLVVK